MSGSRKLWLLLSLISSLLVGKALAAARINSFNLVDENRLKSEHRVARYRGGQVSL